MRFLRFVLAAMVVAPSQLGYTNGPELDLTACAPDSVVRFVAKEIPNHFRKLREREYLIEFIPECQSDLPYGGQLRVLLLCKDRDAGCGDPSTMLIKDRRARDPVEWFLISNDQGIWARSDRIGCVEHPARLLTLKPAKEPTLEESQRMFNEIIQAIFQKIRSGSR